MRNCRILGIPEMVEMEGSDQSSKQPLQISDMFQKLALTFRAKTYELFLEDSAAVAESDDDVTFLFDSAEEFIPDQKVVVIKRELGAAGVDDSGDGLIGRLIHSLFATLSSFEASYLQFQTAHVPIVDQNALEQADRSIVSILQKLTELRNLYKDSKKGSLVLDCGFDVPATSFLEFQVQENQSKLRVLETIVNSLQSQIDAKDDEMRNLRKKLDEFRVPNVDLDGNLDSKEGNMGSGREALLTVRVFEAMLGDSVKSLRCFTKLLIDLMKNAGWDLEEASKYVHSGMNLAKKGHFRYAFLSYVCLGMFQNFDKTDFGLYNSKYLCKGNCSIPSVNVDIDGEDNCYWRQLIEHATVSPMEILRKTPKCEFSQFCERKYEGLIHPTMELSIFSNLDRKDKVLDSWKSLTLFFESFVRMASSIWLLHRLAHSFNPAVEIFQVERGTKFSMVYMEDVLGKHSFPGKTRPTVGFTVVPGFKIGRTAIQAQVYLTNLQNTK